MNEKDLSTILDCVYTNSLVYTHELEKIKKTIRRQKNVTRLALALTLATTAYMAVTSRVQYVEQGTKVDNLEKELRELRRKQEGK
jgi:hypothetical protein